MRFQFGNCELDLDRVELRVDGAVRAVEPQVFDVLAVLLKHRDRVVSKDELLDEVWQHRFVSESSLTSRIKSARQAIGDDGQAQRLIRTVHGRGYQFVGEVQVGGPVHAAAATPVPRPATQTIGRADDVNRVLDLLGRASIVTLLGAGGIGKTRLAIEVALQWGSGETCFVDLTRVREAAFVPDLIIQELGVHSGTAADSRQILAEALRGRSLLLLDNFEHVIDAADLVTAMVQWAPGLRVLVTSRARLLVGGEHVYDVAPLAVEPAGRGDGSIAAAVALFNQVATAVDADFQLDSNLEDVAAICRTVDGLPLAVELAAGHIRTLPPPLLRTRLSAQLGSAAGAARDRPARQQTIPATIDWSLQLLGESERGLFAQLGVFSGPVPLEMIEQVCELPAGATVVESLGRLLDQSMVRRVTGPAGTHRFALLELLRERARELLAEQGAAEVVAGRHARYVVARCEEIEERKWTDLSDRWIDVTTELLGEIRAGHAWAQARGEAELAARIAASLGTFWHREGYHREGRQWVAAALQQAPAFDPLLVARLELAAGLLNWSRDQATAREHCARAAAAFRTLGHDRYLAYALALNSVTYVGNRDHYRIAIAQCDEAIELARRVNERPLIAQALNIKGELTRVHGDDDLASAVYEEGRDLAAAAGDRAHLSMFLANLAYLAEHRGDHVEAHRLASEGLRLCHSLGRRMMAAWSVSELAGPECSLGRPERGAVLVGAADEALRVMGAARHLGDLPEHATVVEGLRTTLGPVEFDSWYAAGTRLSLDQAVALALAEPDEAELPHPSASVSTESAVSPASPATAPG
jgi:predicted ATPase/DNA-binding winged helix-turn-helix (wHTH) protein